MRRGEILVAAEVGSNGLQTVPHGLIHDWIGAAFIPGVTLPQVFAVVDDYGRYNEFYKPSVVEAEALVCKDPQSEGEERFRVRYAQKMLFVSEFVDTEYKVRRVRLDDRRWYSISQSTNIEEIRDQSKANENGSKANQSDTSGDGGSRYLWRIYCITRYEERDGGVYMEQENIALSRGIPVSLRWLVEPAIRQLSKDLTVTSLRQTREAVGSAAGHPVVPPIVKSGG